MRTGLNNLSNVDLKEPLNHTLPLLRRRDVSTRMGQRLEFDQFLWWWGEVRIYLQLVVSRAGIYT